MLDCGNGAMAQLGAHLTCTQGVVGSNLTSSTKFREPLQTQKIW